VAVTPDGSKVYVTNEGLPGTVSVIDTTTNMVTATIPVGLFPFGVALSPDGSKVYVTNQGVVGGNNVSVIDTTTNRVNASITLVGNPFGVAVTPDGSKVYVTTEPSGVSVIDTATNAVTATLGIGSGDTAAFGVFIQPAKPAPKFAGTPGQSNCFGQSVSALAQQYHGLNAAAAALGFSSVKALQNAILAFCGG
jgi:YVTN family beta-propeller protein